MPITELKIVLIPLKEVDFLKGCLIYNQIFKVLQLDQY